MPGTTAGEIAGVGWVFSPPRPHRHRSGPRLIGLVAWALTFLAVGAWTVFLRPQLLGGPATYVLVSGTSMEPTLHNGDIVVVRRHESYRIGQIVAFRVPRGEVGAGAIVIHRITGGAALGGYELEGDNRETPDLWHPHATDIVGAKWLRILGGGRVFTFLRSPLGVAIVAGLLAFLIMVTAPQSEARKQGSSSTWIPAPLFLRPKHPTDDREARLPQPENHRRPPSPVGALADEPQGAQIPVGAQERPAVPVDAHGPGSLSRQRRPHTVDQRRLPTSTRGGVHSSDRRRLGSTSDRGGPFPGRARPRVGRRAPRLTLLDGVDQAFREARARTAERAGPVPR